MNGRLEVSKNGRHLVHADGRPFFYLADTAWELFHRLSIVESETYLRDRADKGFNVIQAVVLSELEGLTDPNAQGDLPLIDGDVERPNPAYFQHIDAVIGLAESLGLYIGMLPTWGRYWKAGEGEAPLFSAKNAFRYGEWLGNRYRGRSVIWILGGDRVPNAAEAMVVGHMAEGLRAADGGEHLTTFHPCGPGQSSAHFHHAAWLDFNMNQTSHAARDHFNGAFIRKDYGLVPVKPTIDGEPRYENLPVGFYNAGIARPSDRFDDFDIRQCAYWSVMSGACGHTYGNNSIWQMYDVGRAPVIDADVPWHEAVHHPGARQMGYMRRFFESCRFGELVPANELLFDAVQSGGGRTVAMRSADDGIHLVYSPHGQPFGLDIGERFEMRCASWFNPRYNTQHAFLRSGTGSLQTYVPPTSGRGNDWMLLLERI